MVPLVALAPSSSIKSGELNKRKIDENGSTVPVSRNLTVSFPLKISIINSTHYANGDENGTRNGIRKWKWIAYFREYAGKRRRRLEGTQKEGNKKKIMNFMKKNKQLRNLLNNVAAQGRIECDIRDKRVERWMEKWRWWRETRWLGEGVL